MPTVRSYGGSEAHITIGSFCSIGPEVQIINGGIHPKSWVSLFPFRIKWKLDGAYEDGMPETRGDIVIGSDVWLGTGALILSGVKIGHGAIVAGASGRDTGCRTVCHRRWMSGQAFGAGFRLRSSSNFWKFAGGTGTTFVSAKRFPSSPVPISIIFCKSIICRRRIEQCLRV